MVWLANFRRNTFSVYFVNQCDRSTLCECDFCCVERLRRSQWDDGRFCCVVSSAHLVSRTVRLLFSAWPSSAIKTGTSKDIRPSGSERTRRPERPVPPSTTSALFLGRTPACPASSSSPWLAGCGGGELASGGGDLVTLERKIFCTLS